VVLPARPPPLLPEATARLVVAAQVVVMEEVAMPLLATLEILPAMQRAATSRVLPSKLVA
jgi:hypothetical protein